MQLSMHSPGHVMHKHTHMYVPFTFPAGCGMYSAVVTPCIVNLTCSHCKVLHTDLCSLPLAALQCKPLCVDFVGPSLLAKLWKEILTGYTRLKVALLTTAQALTHTEAAHGD